MQATERKTVETTPRTHTPHAPCCCRWRTGSSMYVEWKDYYLPPCGLVTSRCDPTDRRSFALACRAPGPVFALQRAWTLNVVSPLTALRNTTIINNITHPHLHAYTYIYIHLDRLAPNQLLTAAQSHGLHVRSKCCKPALHPVIHITVPGACWPRIIANHASCTRPLGEIPGSACLPHAARGHLRYLACITSFAYALLQIGPACSISPTRLYTHLTHLGLPGPQTRSDVRRHA